ncbi:DUF6069 family protein [Streptomyces sp. NPDC002640]
MSGDTSGRRTAWPVPRTVLAAVAAPLATWAVAVPLLGVELNTTTPQGVMEIGPAPIAVVSLLSAVAGWGFVRLLQRWAPRRAKAVWTATGIAVLVLSCLPLADPATTTATRVVLTLLHAVVAAVLLPGLTPLPAGPSSPSPRETRTPTPA